MRSDSGEGITGTTTASAARSTFSDSSEMPGGQSMKSRSQASPSGRTILSRRSVRCLRSLRCTSKLRKDRVAGTTYRFGHSVGTSRSIAASLPETSRFAEASGRDSVLSTYDAAPCGSRSQSTVGLPAAAAT